MSTFIDKNLPLPEVLITFRAQAGAAGHPLSQAAMAAALGVSLRQYQRWERGVSRPRAAQLRQITELMTRGSDVEGHVATDVSRTEFSRLQAEVEALRAELDRLRSARTA
jgi:transcriptional regulator with XRE-family HTH domain